MTGIVINTDEPRPVVLVSVGTTYHRFDRLTGWLESWLTAHPGEVRMIVQHGPSRCPRGAEGFAMCAQEELLGLIAGSDVVVTQGGPGGIMDSRYSGLVPIAVPRDPALDEVVDDHQIRFCRHAAREGLVRLAESEAQLHAELDRALADPGALRIEIDRSHVEAAVHRAGELIEQLVRHRPARHRRRQA